MNVRPQGPVVMLKTLKCAVKAVWVYRKTQWIALFSTDLTLPVEQLIEYYGARWKIEAAFKELKRDIGSAETQIRHPNAVMNHLHFCMMATSVVWIYASRVEKTPNRRHIVRPLHNPVKIPGSMIFLQSCAVHLDYFLQKNRLNYL